MRKTNVKMNKPVYLGMPILDISKTLMYEFWHDYMKQKYDDNVKLCYKIVILIVLSLILKQKIFMKIILKKDDVEKRFDRSNYEIDRPLPTGKVKKAIRLMKEELGGKIMTEFIALRPKTYAYLMDDDSEIKKAKGTKKLVIKKDLKFNDYKDCLLNNEIVLKSQQRFKSKRHDVYTEEINKIALSSNDDKRFQKCLEIL